MPRRPAGIDLYRAGRWLLAAGVAAYLALYAANSLTRTRYFSPDSMNYVSVARNLSRGQGLTQPALGFNQPRWPVDVRLPAPFTAQPPLYPMAVAALGRFVPRSADAALLVAALGYAGILLVGSRLTGALYGRTAEGLALSLLLLNRPLSYLSRFAWSESLGLLLAVLSLWCVVSARREGPRAGWLWLGAGLTAGLAFATRYLLLAAVVGAAGLLNRGRPLRGPAWLYVAGFVPLGAAVLGRNLMLTGSPMGSVANPSSVGLGENLQAVLRVASFEVVPLPPSAAATLLLIGAAAAVGGALAARGRGAFADAFAREGRWLLPVWSLSYLALLVGQRSLIHFDAIDPRLVAPGVVGLALLAAGLVARAFRPPAGASLSLALLTTLLLLGREVQIAQGPPVTEAERIVASERLSWVAQRTTAADLIIGDDTMDIPFYLDRPLVVSFSPYPYTDHPRYDHLAAFARGQGFESAFLILRDRYRTDEQWRRAYGEFIADLVAGRTADYPGLTQAARLADGYVFEWALR